MCAQSSASGRGTQDAIQVWGVVSGCVARGNDNSEFPGVVRVRLWEVWSAGSIFCYVADNIRKSNRVPVLSCFLSLPSTLNTQPSMPFRQARYFTSLPCPYLNIIACSCVATSDLSASEDVTGLDSSSLLDVYTRQEPDFQHLERLVLCKGKGPSGLWMGGRLADVAAWGSVTW